MKAIVCIFPVTVLLLGVGGAHSGQGELKTCGPLDAKHKTMVHANKRPAPDPGPAKALVYFIRSGSTRGAFFQAKLAANGRWIAVLPRGRYYSFAEIDAGVVRLCSTGSNFQPTTQGFAFLTAEEGKSYYFEARLKQGIGFDVGVALDEIDEARGKVLIGESRFVTFETKR
jgi:hypothetical protein